MKPLCGALVCNGVPLPPLELVCNSGEPVTGLGVRLVLFLATWGTFLYVGCSDISILASFDGTTWG